MQFSLISEGQVMLFPKGGCSSFAANHLKYWENSEGLLFYIIVDSMVTCC